MSYTARLMIGGAVAVALLSAYVSWDVAYSRATGNETVAGVNESTDNVVQTMSPRPVRSMNAPTQAVPLPIEVKVNEGPQNPGDSTNNAGLNDVQRRERAQRRADRKVETLNAFFASQARNAWATEKEIELRSMPLPEGVKLDEVSCHSEVCRLVASGTDKMQLLEATSSVGEMKSFARIVPGTEEAPQLVAYLSPSGTKWPRPTFDE